MGAGQSRGDFDLPESDDDYSEEENDDENHDTTSDNENDDKFSTPPPHSSSSFDVDDIDSRLKALKLKYGSNLPSSKGKKPAVTKLYRHVGGVSSESKWVLQKEDDCSYFRFVKSRGNEDENDEEDEDEDDGVQEGSSSEVFWELRVGSRVQARVSSELQLKMFPEQRRVVFIANGCVWALKFMEENNFYDQFVSEYQNCLFENVYGLEANEKNRLKIYGKDFISWANPDSADDTMWDAPDSLDPDSDSGKKSKPKLLENDLLEEFEEEVTNTNGIQSLALGALDNSFLVGTDSIQVVKNFRHGIHGKGVCVKFDTGSKNPSFSTPKKALLMRGETNMMLMSPVAEGKPHASGIHQLDIETGKIVTEWKFGKDGVDIAMRDITSDSKSSQLDPSGSTFLGLDENRLCQWDMRDRWGAVQNIATADNSPVLHWTQGHQFSRGTNFQCFASTGDGSIVVGSIDGKIRLYSKTSMRQAKTAFPSLGSPITHVDVTYDGKWVLATTDTYLLLICTLFTDKDGRTKTGFSGRMGNRASAPRMLKLMPLHAHMAGANSKFRGGQFSWVTEEGNQERHIVVTVGKFSVIWNFEQVKDSTHKCYQNQHGLKSCYCYNIVLKDESIVDSRFMHDKFADCRSPEAPLVVATPMKVTSFSISAKQ